MPETSDLGRAVQDVAEKAQLLVREEIELAKAEMSAKLNKLIKGIVADARSTLARRDPGLDPSQPDGARLRRGAAARRGPGGHGLAQAPAQQPSAVRDGRRGRRIRPRRRHRRGG